MHVGMYDCIRSQRESESGNQPQCQVYSEKQTKKDPIIQDYIKYINSIESIINALESAKHTLNAEGKRGAQSSTNPKNKKLAELNNEVSKFKKKIMPRVGNK